MISGSLLWVLLAILNFLMLNVAGHPWSVTFAFGLWGAKIADFIGGLLKVKFTEAQIENISID